MTKPLSRKRLFIPVSVAFIAVLTLAFSASSSASASSFGWSSTANAAGSQASVPGEEPNAQVQEDFSLLLSELEKTSRQYSGGAIEPHEEADAWISFTGEPGEGVRERIATVSLRIAIRTDAPVTAIELQRALENAHAEIEAVPGVAGATGYSDAREGTVHLSIWRDESLRIEGADSETLRSAQDAGRASAPAGVSVAVDLASGPFPVEEFIGGQNLSNGCTSAFPVIKGAQGGVLSAAHCPDSATGYTFGGAVESGSTDAQWHKASGTPDNVIRYSGSSTRSITSYYLPAVGSSACHYGSSTGYSCSTIMSRNACWPGMGCSFIAVNGSISSGGDSGGPWFYSSAALGVHKGTAYINLGNRSVFTYVGNAISSLGVTLCITAACGVV